MSVKNKNFRWFFLTFLTIAAVFIWLEVYREQPRNFLESVFFDVGQGDAIFFESPLRRQVLVDGGPSAKILAQLGGELPFFDRYLDAIIITHPDVDHISGLVDVLGRYNVGLIVRPGITRDIGEWLAIQKIIDQKKIPVWIASAGQEIDFGDGLRVETLMPPPGMAAGDADNPNHWSVVNRFTFGVRSFLLAADLEEKDEKGLLARGVRLQSDVLKVGHHGSKNSSSENFLGAIRPSLAVVSAGKDNRYGHPHQEVLDRLKGIGAEILRTDITGNIRIISDGSTLKVD